MSINNDIKKAVLKDWLTEFPGLSSYAQNKLYKIIGPFIAGIELLKLPRADEYRPTFSCYPLWKSNEKECLSEPLLLNELKNNQGFQLDIPYLTHKSFFKEAVSCARQQIIISLETDVAIDVLFEMINNQFTHTLVRASPVNQAKLFEFKFLAALYVNDVILIKKILNDISQAAKSWTPNLFEWKFGKVDKWLEKLQEYILLRQDLLNKIEANKQVKKLEILKTSELRQ